MLAEKDGLKRPLFQKDDLLLTTGTSKKFQDLLLTDPTKQEGQDIVAGVVYRFGIFGWYSVGIPW
jgi:hypothetical protein